MLRADLGLFCGDRVDSRQQQGNTARILQGPRKVSDIQKAYSLGRNAATIGATCTSTDIRRAGRKVVDVVSCTFVRSYSMIAGSRSVVH